VCTSHPKSKITNLKVTGYFIHYLLFLYCSFSCSFTQFVHCSFYIYQSVCVCVCVCVVCVYRYVNFEKALQKMIESQGKCSQNYSLIFFFEFFL